MRIFSRERIDARAAVAAQHVRQRDLGVGLRDARRVEVDRRAAVGRLDAVALLDLVEDRLADDVARAERVGELLAVGVQRARRRRRASSRGSSSPACSPARRRRSGGTAARRGRAPRRRGRARSASPRRSRSGGSSRARRAPRPRRSSGRRQRGRRCRRRRCARRTRARQPSVELGSSSRSGAFAKRRAGARLPRLAQLLRDRVPGAVADLEQALRAGAAAAGEPVAAVLRA